MNQSEKYTYIDMKWRKYIRKQARKRATTKESLKLNKKMDFREDNWQTIQFYSLYTFF